MSDNLTYGSGLGKDRSAASTLWAETTNGRWVLRVSDEHWFMVHGSEVVLSPVGIKRAECASHEAAKREAERQYRASLEAMVKRGERLAMEGRAGLAALDKGAVHA